MSFLENWKADSNILKAYIKVKNALEGSLVESEAFEWEWNLEEKIKQISKMIEEISNNENFSIPLYYYKVPKTSGKTRDYYYVPFDYQVLWISFLNVFGPPIDKIMPRYSFGYRLWRPFGKNLETGRWEYGKYSVPGKEIYKSFNMSYKPFRRYQKIFLSSILGIELDDIEKEMFEMENNNEKSVIWVSEYIKNCEGSFDVWKSKFPLFCFSNSNGCDSEKKNLYYMKLDIKKFFPSIKIKKLIENVKKILDFMNFEKNKIEEVSNYLIKLLTFELGGVFGNYEKPENIGLPVGLLASGFMANIYLFNLDVKMDELIKKAFMRGEILGYFRYVDDIVIVSDNIERMLLANRIINCELKNLELIINFDKLKPRILSEYYRLTQFVSENNLKDSYSGDEFLTMLRNLFTLKNPRTNQDQKAENVVKKIERNLRFILNIDDDDVSTEELNNLFLKEFELTRENYHDFQTTVFNEMSVLSEKIFGLSTMENLQESFNRARNLIRAHLDEDKIAPQTRQSFSAHFMTRIIENALKHPPAYKAEHWTNLEQELKLENLSGAIKKREEKENEKNIKSLMKNALADVEYAIVNTPSKTKLYKRYIELVYLIYYDNIQTNVYLKYLLNVINEKIRVEESGIPFLYYELLRYINQVLKEKLNGEDDIPKKFLKDINNIVENMIENKKKFFKRNPMLTAELLDIVVLLKALGYGLSEDAENFVATKLVSNHEHDTMYEFKNLINSKISVYKWLKRETENEKLCYKLLLKLFKFTEYKSFEHINNFLKTLEVNIKEEKDTLEQLKLYSYLLLRIYFSLNEKKAKRLIVEKSLGFLKILFNELDKENSNNSFVNNKNENYNNYRLLQLLLQGTYEGVFPDNMKFRKSISRLIEKISFSSENYQFKKNALAVLRNIKEFLEIRYLEDKSNMGNISVANFLNIINLSYFQKILLSFLLVSINSWKKNTSFIDILEISIDTEKFNKIAKELQSGKRSVESLEEDLRKVFEKEKEDEDEKKGIKDSKENIEKEVKEVTDIPKNLYWLIFQILKGEFLFESLSSPVDYDRKYLFKNIWRKLVEELVVSSDIANIIADNIGKYKRMKLKPYNSPGKELGELLFEELKKLIFLNRPVIKMELPLRVYGDKELKPFIRVGIFQPTVNYFKDDYKYLNEDLKYQKCLVNALRKELIVALKVFKEQNIDLFIAPELSIPQDVEKDLVEWVRKTGIVAIYGIEYVFNKMKQEVRNSYVLLWPYNDINILKIQGFKKFFNYVEKSQFGKRNIKIQESDKIILFTSKNIGVFSILICYDALSLEDLAILKGYVDTIFVPSYNKDINTYRGLADAMSKLVFCNFVIANTGVYGGSVVRIPYYEIHKREALTLEGNGIFGAQVVDIPIKHLQDYRKTIPKLDKNFKDRKFKAFPPGYEYKEI